MKPDVRLAWQNEVTEILAKLCELRREPAFASTLVLVVAGNGDCVEPKIAGRLQFDEPATNGEGR